MTMRQGPSAEDGNNLPVTGATTPPAPGDATTPSPGDVTPPQPPGDTNPPPGPQPPGPGTEPPQPPGQAVSSLRIEPETLNLRSNGVFTCFIQLSSGYRAEDIDSDSLECSNARAIRFNVEGTHH
jgi:hypothetical protein